MNKALQIAVEKAIKLPAERQEDFAKVLEQALGSSKQAQPKREFGFLADAFEITGDIIDTSALWQTDFAVESWERLEFQFARKKEAKAKAKALAHAKIKRLQSDSAE